MRKYYSNRINAGNFMNLDTFQDLVYSTYIAFEQKGYLQERLGINCVDGYITGSINEDFENYFLRKLKKTNIWPVCDNYKNYSKEDIFDLIEILYDLVSKGIDGEYHHWADCGMHYESFNRSEGQKDFRKAINNIISDYDEGYELQENGEITIMGELGLREIFESELPEYDKENINIRVELAVSKYRNRASGIYKRKEAVRELADVLEFIRPKLKNTLHKKDDRDLFNIANNYCIRHHNESQKTEYSPEWLSWIFYLYLSTIHLAIRLISKKEGSI